MAKARFLLGGSVVALSAVSAVVIARSNAPLPRDLSALVVVAGPGLAWVPALRLRDLAVQVLLAVLCSVTAVICVAQLVTYAAAFSWRPCEYGLLGLTALGLAVQILVALARKPGAGQ